jgi:hypothetical protein
MATKRRYSMWGLAAILAGVILTAIEVYGSVTYLVSQAQPNYLVAGGAVVTMVAAILPVLAGRCWRHGRYLLAALLWAAMAPALSVIVCAAVERTGGANDTAERGRQAIAQKLALARATEDEAKADVKADEAKAAAECSRASNGADPRGPLCKAAEERVGKSRQRLETARSGVAQAGVVPHDPMASRIAAVLPVSEAAVRIYQPLILPLAISGLGLLLIAVGAHQPKPRRVWRRRGKRKKRRALGSARKPSSSNNVVPLRARRKNWPRISPIRPRRVGLFFAFSAGSQVLA